VARLLGFAPTGMPKNLKGRELDQHDKNAEPAAKKEGAIFTPYNLLFIKLIFIPDTDSKLLRRVLIVHRFSRVPSPIKIVSSANWSIWN
jgi:hypothetical protein